MVRFYVKSQHICMTHAKFDSFIKIITKKLHTAQHRRRKKKEFIGVFLSVHTFPIQICNGYQPTTQPLPSFLINIRNSCCVLLFLILLLSRLIALRRQIFCVCSWFLVIMIGASPLSRRLLPRFIRIAINRQHVETERSCRLRGGF